MRARNIKPSFFKNEDIGSLPFEARLLFIGLWCMADRKGRLENRPLRMKAELFPYDACTMQTLCNLLAVKGLILIYPEDTKQYIQIINFEKHQYPHIKEQESTIQAPGKHQIKTMVARLNPDVLNPESPILNPESTPLALNPEKAQGSNPAIHPWLLGLDLYTSDSKLMGKIWTVDKAWMAAFPGIDIGMEIKKAHAWEITNPTRVKTNRIKFFNTWLSRAQDRPRMAQPGGFSNAPNVSARVSSDTPIARRFKAAQGLRKVGDEGDAGTVFARFRDRQVHEDPTVKPDAGRSGTDAKPMAGL